MSQESGGVAVLEGRVVGGLRPRRTIWQNLGGFFRQKPLGAFGAIIAAILIIVAIFAPLIATHDPYEATGARDKFATPSSEHFFGGDKLGRDLFSRIVYGSRISLYVGIVSSLVGSTIGMMVGVASVHFGGKVDLIVQRIIDGLMAFPPLIFAIALMAALGADVTNVVIALNIVFIPSTARILRSQALAIRETDYLLTARAVGAGHLRIMYDT